MQRQIKAIEKSMKDKPIENKNSLLFQEELTKMSEKNLRLLLEVFKDFEKAEITEEIQQIFNDLEKAKVKVEELH